ncbi:MAG: class I SAM-dependent methyltransferase [Candidatus Binataceae bacterium]
METGTSQKQKDLILDRFTRTAEVFAHFAVPDRVADAETLVRLVSATKEDRAADLACGPGTLALRFAHHVRWVCGVDLTPKMLALAQKTAAQEKLTNLVLAFGDAQALPFADGSLDLAVTSYSIHHMSDPARVVREMARVLRRGGRAGILDIYAPDDPRGADINNRIEIARDPSHTRSLTKAVLVSMLERAGFQVLGSEIAEHPRSFNHWLHTAGSNPGDPAYEETRRLMESTIADDAAGFHPRHAAPPADHSDPRPDIAMVNTGMLVGARKI